jgi:hypothetical protein
MPVCRRLLRYWDAAQAGHSQFLVNAPFPIRFPDPVEDHACQGVVCCFARALQCWAHTLYMGRPAFPLGTRRGHMSPWALASTCTGLHSPGTLQLASAGYCVWTGQFSRSANPCQGSAGPGPAASSMQLLSGKVSLIRHASFLAGPTLLRRGPPPPGSDSHVTGRPTPLERRLCKSIQS